MAPACFECECAPCEHLTEECPSAARAREGVSLPAAPATPGHQLGCACIECEEAIMRREVARAAELRNA